MTSLHAITGLPPEAAELLASAGIRSTAQLSRQDATALHARLEVLAWQRGRSSLTPTREDVAQWIAVAHMVTPAPELDALIVDEIPEAMPVPTEPSASSGSAAWIPPTLRAARDTTAGGRSDSEADVARRQAAAAAAAEQTWRKLDPAKFISMEDYNEGRTSVQPLSRESLNVKPAAGASDSEGESAEEPPPTTRRTQRIRSTGESLSRWVRRGVVHPRPLHTWLGAMVSVLWRIALITGVPAFIWLVTASAQPSAHTDKVIAASIVLLILGCMQLHFAGRSRCRICSCNLFYSKNCHKNRKAHLIPGLGYVASAALHLLIFGWFRCMYCGTAIRLRPSNNTNGRSRRGESGE